VRFAATLLAAACLTGAVLAGCGDQDDSTPVACLEGAAAYERALKAAPGEVRLDDGTLISDCLAPNQTAGELTQVGEALLETATALNAEARAEPGGEANIQLGYLLGAAQRGAEESEGIHTDLVRRLVVAARYAPGKQPIPREFVIAYRDGFDAGRSGG
jgi:hypothetical protein